MTQAFSQFFLTIFTLFSAINRIASALNHLGGVADDSAAAYADEARINREIKLAKLENKAKPKAAKK